MMIRYWLSHLLLSIPIIRDRQWVWNFVMTTRYMIELGEAWVK